MGRKRNSNDNGDSESRNRSSNGSSQSLFRKLQNSLGNPLRRKSRSSQQSEDGNAITPEEESSSRHLHHHHQRHIIASSSSSSRHGIGPTIALDSQNCIVEDTVEEADWSNEVFALHDEDDDFVASHDQRLATAIEIAPKKMQQNPEIIDVFGVDEPVDLHNSPPRAAWTPDPSVHADSDLDTTLKADDSSKAIVVSPDKQVSHRRRKMKIKASSVQHPKKDSAPKKTSKKSSEGHRNPPNYDHVMRNLGQSKSRKALTRNPDTFPALTHGGAVGAPHRPDEVQSLRQQLEQLKKDYAERDQQGTAALMSIKLFFAPELEKERTLRLTEKQRADAATTLLKDRENLLQRQEHQLRLLQDSFNDLRMSAKRRARLFAEVELHLQQQISVLKMSAKSSGVDVDVGDEDDTIEDVDKHLQYLEDTPHSLRVKLQRRDEMMARLRLRVEELESELSLRNLKSSQEQSSSEEKHHDIHSSKPDVNHDTRSTEIQSLVQQKQDEIQKSHKEIHELEKQLQISQNKLIESQHSLDERKTEVAKLKLSVETLETSRSELESERNLLTEELEQANLTVKQLEAEHKSMCMSLQAEKDQLEQQNDQTKETCENLRSLLESLQAENSDLKTSHSKKIQTLTGEHSQQQRSLQSEIDQLREELASIQDELERLQAKKVVRADSKTQLSEAQSEISSLKSKLKKQRNSLESQLSSLKQEHASAITTLKSEVQELSASNKKLQTSVASWQRKMRDSKQEIATLKKQLSHKKTQLKESQAESASLSATVQRHADKLSAEKERHRIAVQKLTKQVEKLISEFDASQNKIAFKEDLCNQLKEKNRKLQEEKQALAAEKQQLYSQTEMLTKSESEYKSGLTSVTQQIEMLTSDIRQKNSQIEELQSDLNAAKEAMVYDRTNLLLQRVSERDEQIASLEIDGPEKHTKRLAELRRLREDDLMALREQFQKRTELNSFVSDRSMNQSQSTDLSRNDLIEKLELRENESRRLRSYVDQLLSEVLRQDDSVATEIMTGLPRLQQSQVRPLEELHKLSNEALIDLAHERDRDNRKLEMYIDQMLKRVVEVRPSILEMMSFSMQ